MGMGFFVYKETIKSIQSVAFRVETKEQLNILQGMGKDAVQGYYFSKPQFVGEWNPIDLNKKINLLSRPKAASQSKNNLP